jgi:UDP-N-acetylmuramate--alanine ligase
MTNQNRYFFCGIGGSGMLPLALILLDQSRTPAKFEYLRSKGIRLFPHDGCGVTSPEQVVVASAAVEDALPDMATALRTSAKWMNGSLV